MHKFDDQNHKEQLGSFDLSALSIDEFKELGSAELVYRRKMSRDELLQFIPDLKNAPKDQSFDLLMAANGDPILVTDQSQVISNWLDEHDAELTSVH